MVGFACVSLWPQSDHYGADLFVTPRAHQTSTRGHVRCCGHGAVLRWCGAGGVGVG